MFTLIKGASVYAPEFLGKRDILIAFDKIAQVGRNLEYHSLPGLNIVNAEGKLVLPGLIDSHVHITGGGGEGGFATRTKEIDALDLAENGITTVVGVLGTDGVTRSLENLYAKAKALEEEGISTYIYTGSYQVPVTTFTGCIQKDMILVDKVVGVGEIAVSDHRSFYPSKDEMLRIAAEARVGGMMAGKAGIVHLHMGDHPEGLGIIRELTENTPIPVTQFYPTHINRNPKLFQEGIMHVRSGGIIDITAGFEPQNEQDQCIPAYEALKHILEADVNESNITMSSDSNGSMPAFDKDGRLIAIKPVPCSVLLEDIKRAVFGCGLPLEKVLRFVTLNPARILKIDSSKGCIREGFHGDIIIADDELNIEAVFSKGRKLI